MSIKFSHFTRVRHNTTCFARVAWAYVQSYHGLHRHFGEGTQKNLRPPPLWSTRPLCLEADAACHKLCSFYGNGNSNNVCIWLHICSYFRLFYMCFRIVLGVFLQAPRMLLMTKWRTKRCKHNKKYQKAWSSPLISSQFAEFAFVQIYLSLLREITRVPGGGRVAHPDDWQIQIRQISWNQLHWGASAWHLAVVCVLFFHTHSPKN